MPKAAVIAETPATITDRGQTTVPAAIRRKLALGKRDRIVFRELSDGSIVIARQERGTEQHDPVLASFLSFLAEYIGTRPERIRPVPVDLVARARELVEGVEIDLDERLPDEET